jgi:hypothetical protein
MSKKRFFSGVVSLVSVLIASFSASRVTAQQYSDLKYFTVPGCVAVDTRAAGGAFAAGASRTYTVTGSGSFSSQGGSSTGCGVPAMSNSVAQVQAVNLNVIAILPTSNGFFYLSPTDHSSTVSLLNFASGSVTSTNVVVPVNQNPSISGDIQVTYAIAGGHLLVAVTGYYASPQQTVNVHPVPGDPTASGTALLNAFSNLAALTGSIAPSSTRQYLVQLDPGIYDVGTTPLNLLSYVDLAGSGRRDATIIRGTGYGVSLNDGTLVANQVTGFELHDFSIQTTVTSGSNDAIGLWIGKSGCAVRRVNANITSTSSSGAAIGFRSTDTSDTLEDVAASVTGGTDSYGLVFEGSSVASTPFLRRGYFSASGASNTNNGIYVDELASPTVRDTEATGSGGNQAAALNADYGNHNSTGSTLTLIDSTLAASGAFFNYGIIVSGVSNTFNILGTTAVASSGTSYGISETSASSTYSFNRSTLSGGTGSVHLNGAFSAGASQLVGAVSPTSGTCAACYNGSYTALSSTCH